MTSLISNSYFDRERAEKDRQRRRQVATQRAATSKTRDELQKEKKSSIYSRNPKVHILVFGIAWSECSLEFNMSSNFRFS